MRRRIAVAVAALVAGASACEAAGPTADGSAWAPPGLSAQVTIEPRTLPSTYAAGWICQGVLASAGRAYDAVGRPIDRTVPNFALIAPHTTPGLPKEPGQLILSDNSYSNLINYQNKGVPCKTY